MIFSNVIQQQLKHDTPYAWFLRYQSSSSPIFHKQHIEELDERLEAYLDGFLISQRSGNPLLPILNMSDWGSVFTTALTAVRTSDVESFDTALDSVAEGEQAKELSDALCWGNSFEAAKSYLDKVILHKNPLVRLAGITAVGFYTSNIDTRLLDKLLVDESTKVIAATLKIIGENKLSHYVDQIGEFYIHEDEAIRFHAAYSGSLLNADGAHSALQVFCFNENPYLREAIALLYQVVPENQVNQALQRLQKSTLSIRIKAYNIAMAGLPDMMPVLLEWMNDPEYAPLAGEAFSFITGADIENDDLSIMIVEPCEDQEAPLAVKRKLDPWTETYESDLPWPDPELVETWWASNQDGFSNGTRYLAGRTLEQDNLLQTLVDGTQPQRHLANLILSVQDPDRVIKTVKLR